MVFAVIGLQFPGLVRHLPAEDPGFVWVALALTGVLLLTRIAFVFPVAYLPRLVGSAVRAGRGRQPVEWPPWQAIAVVWWAGTRGVVPLAAALSIPLAVAGGRPFPERDLLLVLATSCIILTLVVQGFTLRPLVRRLGVSDDPARAEREEAVARHAVAAAARARLQELLDLRGTPPAVADRLLAALDQQVERSRQRLERTARTDGSVRDPPDPAGGPLSAGRVYRDLRRDLLAVQTAELLRLRDAGTISEHVRRQVQRSVDLEEAGLTDE